MKLHRKLILMSATLLLAGAGPASAPSGTHWAGAKVDVWSLLDLRSGRSFGGGGGMAGGRTGASLDIRSSLCRNLSFDAKQMLGIDPDTLQEYVIFRPVEDAANRQDAQAGQPGSGEPIRMDLILNLDDKAQPAAQEFLDKMIDELPHAINEVQRSPLERELQSMELEVKQADQNRQRNADLNDELRGLGIADRTPQGIQALAHNLDEQRQQLTLENAAQSAQLEALRKAVDRITEDAQVRAKNDAVAKEMQTIVDVKEKKLELLQAMYRAGTAAASEASDAESAAAEARVQLLERREAVAKAAGGDALADFQKQSVVLEVNVAQDKARLDAIEGQSNALNKAVELATQIHDSNHPQADFNDRANLKIQEVNAQLNEIPKASVRVVSKTAR